MSGLRQLPPHPTPPPTAQPSTQHPLPAQPPPQPPPQHLHFSVPVMPHVAPPLWVDPTPIAVAPPHHVHYLPLPLPPQHNHNPPHNLPHHPKQPPAPRPRKPYTTTKVREMWSPSEHQRMIDALKLFKRDWAKVTQHVGTRSIAQVRSHAQKYFDKVAREKTDDYVPRARPKRKSAAPYPRKLRELPSARPSHTSSNPTAPAAHPAPPPTPPLAPPASASPHPHPATPQPYPVPLHQLHSVLPPSHSIHSASPVHPHQMHLQYAASPNPFVPHLHHSPYLAHPHHQLPVQQQPNAQPIFSPYLNICPTQSPNVQRPNFPASAHPSPMSYVSGHTYAQSPTPQPHHMPIAQPVFNVVSPITPAPYPSPAVAPSPSGAQTPAALVPLTPLQHQTPQLSHFHSHPGGPMDNCAKCNALRRYGTVLQEIVQIGGSHPPQSAHVVHTATRPPAWSPPQQQPQHLASKPDSPPAPKPPNQATDSTACATNQDPSASTSGKKTIDHSLPSSDDSRKNTGSSTRIPAKSRAHRSRLPKSRKHTLKRPIVEDAQNNLSSGEMSESDNFSRRKSTATDSSKPPRNELPQERDTQTSPLSSKKSRKRRPSFSCSNLISMQAPNVDSSTGPRPMKKARCVPIAPSPRLAKPTPKRPRLEPLTDRNLSVVHTKDVKRKTDQENAKVLSKEERRVKRDTPAQPSPNSDSGSGTNSPGVDAYSPKEQKEIFDAVHSLQILSRTPSSSSPSHSESKGNGDDRH